MIQNLHAPKAAYFYDVAERITDKAIDELFRDLRRQAIEPTQNLFRHDREALDGAPRSASVSPIIGPPAFSIRPRG